MVSIASAVLPVWRSPMISSRWPRPIGISASIALRPVCTGSCTERRGTIPGALTSTGARHVGQRSLAVDRLAQGIDDAAQQAAPDRHVDDGAGALDDVALADVPVFAEYDDADIVGLEIEGHAPDAAGKLDHLAGLNIVEAVDAGDAVADRQHLPDLRDIRLAAEIGDFLLQDRRNLRCANFHQNPLSISVLVLCSRPGRKRPLIPAPSSPVAGAPACCAASRRPCASRP